VQRTLARVPRATYLEIGVRHGDSLRAAPAVRKIAVDPVRSAQMQTLRPGEAFYECTSDEFFAHYVTEALAGGHIDVALVDGLHEFRQTYRDVYNLRQHMAPDGMIVLDDCNPPSAERATPTPSPGLWNGDVWKVMALLNQVLPDGQLFTIDADQGIGILLDFSQSWPEPDSEIVQEIWSLTYEHLARGRAKVLRLVTPEIFASATA